MAIEIKAIGGYAEVGKNMTAVKVDDEVIVIDMGLHLPNYIKITEEEGEQVIKLKANDLIRARAIPNSDLIRDWKDKVKAIVPTHAHLDHLGAIPFLANRFKDAQIICTPFSAAVLRAILKDEKIKLPNKIRPINPNSKIKISDKITIELVNVTHSTPQSSIVVIHTPYGAVVYAADFKLDNSPTLGTKPNYAALEKIGNSGVAIAIINALYAPYDGKCPSENVAKEMLRGVMMDVDSRGKAIIATTFSSHIARLKSICFFAKKLNRKVIFLGRSLAKYIDAASVANIVKLEKEGEVCRFAKQIARKLKQIQKTGPEKYLLVVTGHQGEPKATLSKMANGLYPFLFEDEDEVIFSCNVIPTPINKAYRQILDDHLKSKGVRIFKGAHVSGHGRKEDIRDLIKLLKPKHIVPVHCEKPAMDAFLELGTKMGYEEGKTAHQLLNSQSLFIE
ncbi:RNase J family beta-CASP ribonuclease [Candidatus Woesearchaeota archaeon]|nr:RNase J family beta-CASP ribonuclease [Candidatus Woesearchaeota archaeon]MBW2994516.1 RNase J family beta-CASP ribonuclease [Candidatus Woesearchaeota archaeon]